MWPLFIRADASPAMGSGHIMRCRALAAAARTLGISVVMGGRCTVPWLLPVLQQEGFIFFDTPVPEAEKPHALVAQFRRMGAQSGDPCSVVLDGYHFGPDCHDAIRGLGYRLLVIDDYAHLPRYDCDLLLNQNPDASHWDYSGKQSLRLLGLDYALLRPEFFTPPARDENSSIVLISLGGGQFLHHLEQLAPALTQPSLQGRTLKILAGSMEEDEVAHTLIHCPAQVEILPRVDNMPALLATTSVCISAGGSTCWELCRMGVPFLTVEVAENQHGIVDWLDKNGIAPRFSQENLELFLQNNKLRRAVSTRCQALVDGQGAMRVAKQILL